MLIKSPLILSQLPLLLAMVYTFLAQKLDSFKLHYLKESIARWTTLLVRPTSFISALLPIVWVSRSFKPVGDDPRELKDYRTWEAKTRSNQRKSRDLYLLDELLSKTSRQSVALNGFIATLTIINKTSFQDRVRQVAEDFDNDTERITIHVSIISSKEYCSTMATISWNNEEEFTTS